MDKEHKLLLWQLTAASLFYNTDTTCHTHTSVHNLVTSEEQFLISRNTQFSITDLTPVHNFPFTKSAPSFTFQCFACYWNVQRPSIHLPVLVEGKTAQTTWSLNYKWVIFVSQNCLWHDVKLKEGPYHNSSSCCQLFTADTKV